MYCSNCGCNLENGMNFCPNCGKAIHESDIAQSNTSIEVMDSGAAAAKINHGARNIVILSSLAAVIVLIIAIVSMSNNPKHYIVGTWACTQYSAYKVQFKGDGTSQLITRNQSQSSTYKVTDDKTVTVYYSETSGSIKKNSVKFTIVNKETLKLDVPNTKLYFKKVK